MSFILGKTFVFPTHPTKYARINANRLDKIFSGPHTKMFLLFFQLREVLNIRHPAAQHTNFECRVARHSNVKYRMSCGLTYECLMSCISTFECQIFSQLHAAYFFHKGGLTFIQIFFSGDNLHKMSNTTFFDKLGELSSSCRLLNLPETGNIQANMV